VRGVLKALKKNVQAIHRKASEAGGAREDREKTEKKEDRVPAI